MTEATSTTSPAKRYQRSITRAEHVGSLLRPAALLEATQAQVHTVASAVDARAAADLRELTEEHVRRVVARQESIGLEVVTDGEFGRIMFTDSFYGAIDGFDLTEAKLVWNDETGKQIETPFTPAAVRRLQRTGSPLATEARLLNTITDRKYKLTLPAVSIACAPEAYRPDLFGDAYADADDLADHLVTLEREIIDDAVAEGAKYIQVDLGMYPYLVDPDQARRLADMRVDTEALLDRFLRVDRATIDGLPEDVETAMHLCRGNLKSMWLWRGSLEPVAERMFHELPFDRFLIEMDNVEREGDFSFLRHVPQGDAGPVIVLGIVSSKTSRLEDEDALIRAIDEASKYVPVEQLAISPQCGFASNADGNDLSEDDQWRKLELIVRVAHRVW
jgi:5-methyltetrahydropteroyltriglutamate--homocysteine methyltransferase